MEFIKSHSLNNRRRRFFTSLSLRAGISYPLAGKIVVLFLLTLFLCSCQHRELCGDDPCEIDTEFPTQVYIHWDGVSTEDKPGKGMAVYFYPPSGQHIRDNLPAEGGRMNLPLGVPYTVFCFDYYGNDHINFRNDSFMEQFEAYSTAARGTYNTYGPGSRAGQTEPTVAEPYPYNFHVTRGEETFTATEHADNVLHFYPRNVLREFTFLIVDVDGAENISSAHGAMSGMSPTYRMHDGAMSNEPATVLFGNKYGRVRWYPSARQVDWTQGMLDAAFGGGVLMDDWPEGWSSSTGWAGGWIIGRFCSFGPAAADDVRNGLTVEVLSTGGGYHFAEWGGAQEDAVREQIAGAMGHNGTLEEQLAWRRRNGGFDIVLQNDGRLEIPDAVEGGQGGIEIDVPDFDNVYVPLPLN